jgi:hypothetical protein
VRHEEIAKNHVPKMPEKEVPYSSIQQRPFQQEQRQGIVQVRLVLQRLNELQEVLRIRSEE